MNPRFIDWIWHIRGSLALAPEQSSEDALSRLDPLFRQAGTSHERANGLLTFRKKDQVSQDKMSVFDSGVLQVTQGDGGPVLHYHLISKALLFCFVLPLLFLGFAQLTIAIGKFEKAPAQSTLKSGGPKNSAVKGGEKDAVPAQNPIDKALGAPAPEKPKKEGAKGAGEDKKMSPTSAYVFAAIFAVLYVIGRVIEARMVKSLFRKALQTLSPC